jgi:uncharacterized protein
MTLTLTLQSTITAFAGTTRLARGPLSDVAQAMRRHHSRHPDIPLHAFDDASGQPLDFDLRGSAAEVLARLEERFSRQPAAEAPQAPEPARGPGRPKLGVVAREVTLLPRQWEWLAVQPGGASVALRRLVDEARRADGGAKARQRNAQEACYRFLSAMAGNLPGFEEAARALFANRAEDFEARLAGWPADVAEHARTLAEAAFTGSSGAQA